MTATVSRTAQQGADHRSWLARHPVTGYALLAYGLSWMLWAPAILGGGGPVVITLYYLGGLGPAISALLVLRATGGDVRAWARQIVRWRVPLRYYAYALGLPAALFVVVNLELVLLGKHVDISVLPSRLSSYAATFLLVVTIGGGFEEPGWRGFALPRLQHDHSPVRATLMLGVIWAVWHVPLYGLGFVGPLAFVFFYTWLYNKTGSVLLCILLHASFTPALDHLVLIRDNLTVDLAILVTLVAAAVALVLLTRGRLGFTPAAGPGSSRPATHS